PLPAQNGIDLGQRPGDAMADGAGLSRDTAAMYAYPHVHLALVAGGQQGLANERLMLMAREVLLEAPLVDLEATAPGEQDHPGDRGLSLAGGLDPRVAGHL